MRWNIDDAAGFVCGMPNHPPCLNAACHASAQPQVLFELSLPPTKDAAGFEISAKSSVLLPTGEDAAEGPEVDRWRLAAAEGAGSVTEGDAAGGSGEPRAPGESGCSHTLVLCAVPGTHAAARLPAAVSWE